LVISYTFTFFVNKVLKVLSALRTFFNVIKSLSIRLDRYSEYMYNTFVEVDKGLKYKKHREHEVYHERQ
jgi:hypothetical protein